MGWKATLMRIAAEAEHGLDRTRHAVDRAIGRERPVRVVAYHGYGRPDFVRIRGRVLHGTPPGPARPADPWWVNFANTYRRLESDEVAGARVRVWFGGASTEVVSDDEGHFVAELELESAPAEDLLWHGATIELIDPVGPNGPNTPVPATVAIPRNSRFGVISDLDDTVLQSDVRDIVRMGREVLFGNVHTRIPFAGVGEFYRALNTGEEGAVNPIFYVSSSPWNLYDLLVEFLRLHDVPAGPMYLRDWGISRSELLPTGHGAHKRQAIDTILDTYPDLPFILVGDSGQEDPEIYRKVIHERPGRILGVYIRSVVAEPLRIGEVDALAREIAEAHRDAEDGGPELVLVEDTMEAARHAAARGWLDPRRLDGIARQRASER